MAIRLRRRANRRINSNLPIHSLHTQDQEEEEDDDTNPYPFDKKLPKANEYPKRIDILHLLHDLYALDSSNVADHCLLEKIKNEIGNPKIVFLPQLAEFVKFSVHKIVKTYYYGSFAMRPFYDQCPNWMLLLYHNNNNNTDIYQKLSIISPILSLFDANIYYDALNDDEMISLISSLIIIRRNVPYSKLKGVDHQLSEEQNYNKYAIDYRHLFGDKLVSYLLLDLCKYILTFVDIKSFFSCCMINHCWLHFIYRNDTFFSIYKQIICGNKQLQCILLDHSILSQVHIAIAPITFGWTLESNNNSYLDFVTLKNHWFQQYIHIIKITLQQKAKATDTDTIATDTEWIDIKQDIKSSNQIGFDSILFQQGFQFDINAEYRLQINILKPFKSLTIYSNINKLHPMQWILKYNESRARDIDIDTETDKKLFNTHKFWFAFYIDLLQSLNTNVIADVLKNLRICENRIRSDALYLMQQYNKNDCYLFKTIIRYVLHENNKIKLNAMRCLRRIAIQDSDAKDMQHFYLTALAKYGLIRICSNMLMAMPVNADKTIGSLREQMLWFLGYFVKTGAKWKSVVIKEMHIHKFLNFLIEEIKLNRDPKYTASYIWTLSKFFSLYRQTRAEDLACDNHQILNANLGKICVELVWDSFRLSFSRYTKLKSQQLVDIRTNLMCNDILNYNDGEDAKEKDVERQTEIDGFNQLARDSYYAYSLLLRYFRNEILDIIDMKMLGNIINDFDLSDGGMDYEFKLRMVKTSVSCCIDTIFRLNKCNKQIFEYFYVERLIAILDGMIAKLKFLVMVKDKNINSSEDGADEKAKDDQFMMLFAPILEAVPMILTNIHILENPKAKLIKLLHQIVDVAVLHNDYLNVCDFSNQSKQQIEERKQSLQDQICCTMSVIWDILSKYGEIIREYITNNDKIMYLIQNKWVTHHNMVTANQAQSLLAALQNDEAFNTLFKDNSDNEVGGDDVMCPCGDALRLIQAKDCYASSTYFYLYCDYCREKIDWGLNPTRMVYHCDKKEKVHPHGFDLCVNCAKRKLILDITK